MWNTKSWNVTLYDTFGIKKKAVQIWRGRLTTQNTLITLTTKLRCIYHRVTRSALTSSTNHRSHAFAGVIKRFCRFSLFNHFDMDVCYSWMFRPETVWNLERSSECNTNLLATKYTAISQPKTEGIAKTMSFQEMHTLIVLRCMDAICPFSCNYLVC